MPSNVSWRSRWGKDAVLAPVYHPLLHGGTRAGGVRALAYPAVGPLRLKQNWPVAGAGPKPFTVVLAFGHSAAVVTAPTKTWSAAVFWQRLNLSSVGTANG